MAKKSKNPIETLREAGVDVEKLTMPPEMKTKYDAYKQRLADQAAGYKEGAKDNKTSLPRRAAGALLVNPVTKTALVAGLGTYGVLTGLKAANMHPSWLNAGVLDRASTSSAEWLRSFGSGGATR